MADTFIVIGGTGGIGSALARRLVADQNHVHLIARDPEKLDEIAKQLGASQAVADVLDTAALKVAIEAAPQPVAGLAYCVGSINLKPLHRLTTEEILADFTLNAASAAFAIQSALPALKAYSGTAAIVLFSTVAVAQGFSGHASVAMAKGAIEGLTRALAAELAPKIRVNAVAPSLTRTPLAQALTNNEAMAASIANLHALGRLGEADDAAAAAAFLLGPEAGWITGQVLGVDGGRSTLRTKG